MGQKGLLQSPRYRRFIAERDRALEKIHQHAQTDTSRYLFQTLEEIEKDVLHLAAKGHQTVLNLQNISYRLENTTVHTFSKLVAKLSIRMRDMRRSTYILSYLAQSEAIGQSAQIKAKSGITKNKLHQIEKSKTILNEELNNRIWMDVMRLRERIMQAFRLALVQELPAKEVVAKVKKVFPKIRVYKKSPRMLSPIREANYPVGKKNTFQFKFVDEDDWESAVDDYKNTQLPATRFDNEAIEVDEDAQIQYNWELEQSLTQDFVEQVRKGDVEAAKDLGIQEFVWVAVLDDRTDLCCEERHGLTTSEIAQRVEDEDFESDCDALYPPAHFNCRCQVSPVASAEEVEGPDWASFKDWLDS